MTCKQLVKGCYKTAQVGVEPTTIEMQGRLKLQRIVVFLYRPDSVIRVKCCIPGWNPTVAQGTLWNFCKQGNYSQSFWANSS